VNPAPAGKDLFTQALGQHQAGQLLLAQQGYERVLQDQPQHFDALHLLGVIAQQCGDNVRSVSLIQQALQVGAATAAAHNNLGNAYLNLAQPAEALRHYRLGLQLDPHFVQAHFNCGNALCALQQHTAALSHLTAATTLRPDYAEAWLSLGNAHFHLQQLPQAVPAYQRALSVQPDNAATHRNLATALLALGDFTAAIEHFDAALRLQPDTPECHYNRAAALTQLRHYAAAAAGYERALQLRPQYELARGLALHMRLRRCDWSGFETASAQIAQQLALEQLVTPTFPALAMFDDAALHLRAARRFSQTLPQQPAPGLPVGDADPQRKLRIGYFSAEFHDHAVANQMVELYEQHDRSRFEIFAFSLAAPKHDAVRQRLQASFDGFFDVHADSDHAVVDRARQLRLDIAVDLNGYSGRGRPAVFALRCAPVQVSYLGYPGTTGAGFMDYLVADAQVIPAAHRDSYAEKIIQLPGCFMVNPAQRPIAERVFARRDFGLPDSGFVFRCYNNSYKILPETFACWMRLLARVPGSVLWLLADSDDVPTQLRAAAATHGIDPQRLIFSGHLPLAEHYARNRLADLFLDTFPFGAHSTGADALWSGLPVLTRRGESFASRVCASLLTELGLDELITDSAEAYEAKALELAGNPATLAALRQRLWTQRQACTLYQPALFASRLEQAFLHIHRGALLGAAPEHLEIAP
jgi:tetratricopeptide (TPR) repeat protein